jgi:hypothetical protein
LDEKQQMELAGKEHKAIDASSRRTWRRRSRKLPEKQQKAIEVRNRRTWTRSSI